FPMSHIKEAKQAIEDFVTKTDDKVEMFNRVKSLADQDQQWRYNTTTEFTVDENKDIIVSRVFNININAQDYHNDAEKNTMH
ncbi:type III effector protein, partial [Escherichia coli]|nr:type III effector protein [Escherichia coli]